jgi:hypothetical protein
MGQHVKRPGMGPERRLSDLTLQPNRQQHGEFVRKHVVDYSLFADRGGKARKQSVGPLAGQMTVRLRSRCGTWIPRQGMWGS